jgi:hypothetical protein
MHVRWPKLAVAVGSLLVLAGADGAAVHAGVLLEDHFDDTNIIDGTDSLDTNWYSFNTSSNGTAWGTSTDNTAPLSGTVLNQPLDSRAQYTEARGAFPGGSVTLNPGDTIKVWLDVRSTSASTESDSALVVRLGDDNGTPLTANQLGTASSATDDLFAWVGYITPSSGTFTGAINEGGGNRSHTSSGFAALENSSPHSIAITATRDNSNKLLTTLTISGTQIGTATTAVDAAPATFTFNELGLFWYGFNAAHNIDNIKVEYVPVPEPVGVGLFGLAAMLSLLRRRARN